ncbi:PaaI family thioesterase [uncultured Dialister sp.]|jgi:acyl-CoA thioesterase FadM|nr:hotdog fold domain-containing protein [uncultured Dialister sp.]
MESRFRSPILIGETVKVVCREVKRKGPLAVMEAEVMHEDGTVAAEALSHMMFERPKKG